MSGGICNFKDKGIEFVKKAVAADNAGEYDEAIHNYATACQYFLTYLKYEKSESARNIVLPKLDDYMKRAEHLKGILRDGQPVVVTPAANGNSAQQARPGGKANAGGGGGSGGGGGGDGNDAEKEKLRASLGSAILAERPNWNDVAGLESAKDSLKEAVILPVKFPQFFTGKRKPWSGLLLYGPPGTGKSYLAKAVATEAESTFFTVSSSDLVSKWMGESEKLVSQLFSLAREHSPSIVFIDEIDALCSTRGEGESEAARRIKTEFLVQMQGVHTSEARVLVLGATNLPYGLDQAVRRRFDKRIYIALPEEKARAHMFKVHLGDTPHNLTQQDFMELAKRTEGFSGSDVNVVVKDVLMEPVRMTQEAEFFITVEENGSKFLHPCAPGTPGAMQATLTQIAEKGQAAMVAPPPINMKMFLKVVQKARPTVSVADLDVYKKFTAEFGEEG
eukprot:jgi/Astpho2/2717/Aster-00903